MRLFINTVIGLLAHLLAQASCSLDFDITELFNDTPDTGIFHLLSTSEPTTRPQGLTSAGTPSSIVRGYATVGGNLAIPSRHAELPAHQASQDHRYTDDAGRFASISDPMTPAEPEPPFVGSRASTEVAPEIIDHHNDAQRRFGDLVMKPRQRPESSRSIPAVVTSPSILPRQGVARSAQDSNHDVVEPFEYPSNQARTSNGQQRSKPLYVPVLSSTYSEERHRFPPGTSSETSSIDQTRDSKSSLGPGPYGWEKPISPLFTRKLMEESADWMLKQPVVTHALVCAHWYDWLKNFVLGPGAVAGIRPERPESARSFLKRKKETLRFAISRANENGGLFRWISGDERSGNELMDFFSNPDGSLVKQTAKESDVHHIRERTLIFLTYVKLINTFRQEIEKNYEPSTINQQQVIASDFIQNFWDDYNTSERIFWSAKRRDELSARMKLLEDVKFIRSDKCLTIVWQLLSYWFKERFGISDADKGFYAALMIATIETIIQKFDTQTSHHDEDKNDAHLIVEALQPKFKQCTYHVWPNRPKVLLKPGKPLVSRKRKSRESRFA